MSVCCGQPASRVAGRRRTWADSQRAARHAPGSFCAPASLQPCAAWPTTLWEPPPTKLLRRGADEVGALQVAQLRVAVTAELGDAHAQPPEALRPVLVALLDERPGGGRPREDENEGGRPGQCSSAPCANVCHSSCSRTEALGGREAASHPPDRRPVYGLDSALEGRELAVLGQALAPQPEEGELHHACVQWRQRSSPTGDSMAASVPPANLGHATTSAADAHLSCRCRLGPPPPGTSRNRARRQSTLTEPG